MQVKLDIVGNENMFKIYRNASKFIIESIKSGRCFLSNVLLLLCQFHINLFFLFGKLGTSRLSGYGVEEEGKKNF